MAFWTLTINDKQDLAFPHTGRMRPRYLTTLNPFLDKWVPKGKPMLVDSSNPRWGEKASCYSPVCLETREAVREYLKTPRLGLRLVNLPGYGPDFNADEAVWDG